MFAIVEYQRPSATFCSAHSIYCKGHSSAAKTLYVSRQYQWYDSIPDSLIVLHLMILFPCQLAAFHLHAILTSITQDAAPTLTVIQPQKLAPARIGTVTLLGRRKCPGCAPHALLTEWHPGLQALPQRCHNPSACTGCSHITAQVHCCCFRGIMSIRTLRLPAAVAAAAAVAEAEVAVEGTPAIQWTPQDWPAYRRAAFGEYVP